MGWSFTIFSRRNIPLIVDNLLNCKTIPERFDYFGLFTLVSYYRIMVSEDDDLSTISSIELEWPALKIRWGVKAINSQNENMYEK